MGAESATRRSSPQCFAQIGRDSDSLEQTELEIAKIHVAGVLDAAGLLSRAGGQTNALAEVEESLHNKQNAALSVLQQRANSAAKQAVVRQEEML